MSHLGSRTLLNAWRKGASEVLNNPGLPRRAENEGRMIDGPSLISIDGWEQTNGTVALRAEDLIPPSKWMVGVTLASCDENPVGGSKWCDPCTLGWGQAGVTFTPRAETRSGGQNGVTLAPWAGVKMV